MNLPRNVRNVGGTSASLFHKALSLLREVAGMRKDTAKGKNPKQRPVQLAAPVPHVLQLLDEADKIPLTWGFFLAKTSVGPFRIRSF